MPKFRKKPVVINAVQFDGKIATLEPLLALGVPDCSVEQEFSENWAEIVTLEGTMRCEPGDWVIRGIKGELYPCRNDIFEATYEPAD